jgi:hypothetical protein
MRWLVRFSTSRIFALFLFAFRCLAADHAADRQDDSIVLKDGFVFVNAIINGHGPFRMLVDTGTTTTLLAPEAAAAAGLKFDHRIVLTSLGGEKPLLATSTAELQVGSGIATGVEIAVAAIGHVRKIDPGAHGILGQSFLSRSAFLIDYARKKLWLGEDAIRRAEELPFVISTSQASGRTIVPVTLQAGGPSWHLTLDSGAFTLYWSIPICPMARTTVLFRVTGSPRFMWTAIRAWSGWRSAVNEPAGLAIQLLEESRVVLGAQILPKREIQEKPA